LFTFESAASAQLDSFQKAVNNHEEELFEAIIGQMDKFVAETQASFKPSIFCNKKWEGKKQLSKILLA
jgi:hypothetical protein